MLEMGQPITRLYENEKTALGAVSELKKSGFPGEQIVLVTPKDAKAMPNGAEEDTLVAAFEKAGVSKAAAAIYAERVRAGGSVVSVSPNWGTGQRATKILERFDPVDAGVGEVEASAAASNASGAQTGKRDAGALFSSFLNWPVLRNDPAPLSTWLKWPLISQRAAPLSQDAKLAVISDNATPLSSFLKWPLISGNATPLSTWLKRPVLSDKATPLSDWAKAPVIVNDPTPLSKKLGVKTLS
jgi:hypothetical protein